MQFINLFCIKYIRKSIATISYIITSVDITCRTILNEDVQQLEGEWTIKNAGYSFSTDISCPNHNFKMDWDLSSLSGTFNSQYTNGTDIFRSVASFKRSATPFKYVLLNRHFVLVQYIAQYAELVNWKLCYICMCWCY